MMSSPQKARRWTRQAADLPVRVFHHKQGGDVVVAGRGTEISEGGMALYAGIPLEPGDLMEVEFQTPNHKRVSAIVRSRSGYYFGLEFLTPLEPDEPEPTTPTLSASNASRSSDAYQMLRRKELEVQRLRREIQALRKLVPPAM